MCKCQQSALNDKATTAQDTRTEQIITMMTEQAMVAAGVVGAVIAVSKMADRRKKQNRTKGA